MKVGIGLPAGIPGVSGDLILDWARRADAGPFSSLGVIDRLTYPNFDPLVTLAAAAAVTQRVRLMTTILLAPLRNAGALAKEAASIDALSGGRLTLGLAVGGREDDFRVAPAPFRGRGRRFEAQLALMKRVWSGQPVAEHTGRIGPPPVQPGGPEVLIGGTSPEAVRRVGRWGDGYIAGGSGPERILAVRSIVEASWQAAGRPGKPRFVGTAYVALGADAAARGAAYLRDYYRFRGPVADQIAQSLLSTPAAVRDRVRAFADIGTDELILWPCVPDRDQLDRLAEVTG